MISNTNTKDANLKSSVLNCCCRNIQSNTCLRAATNMCVFYANIYGKKVIFIKTNVFIKTTFKDSKKVKIMRNYVLK